MEVHQPADILVAAIGRKERQRLEPQIVPQTAVFITKFNTGVHLSVRVSGQKGQDSFEIPEPGISADDAGHHVFFPAVDCDGQDERHAGRVQEAEHLFSGRLDVRMDMRLPGIYINDSAVEPRLPDALDELGSFRLKKPEPVS